MEKVMKRYLLLLDTPIGTVRSRIFRARESIINYINGGERKSWIRIKKDYQHYLMAN